MNNNALKKLTAATIAAGMLAAMPAYALAADTGWTKSPKLYEVRTWAGMSEWGDANGKAADAKFFHPRSIAATADGKLLIADSGNHLLRVLTVDRVGTYAGLDLGEDEAGLPVGAMNDATLSEAAFDRPAGIAIDRQGNIYVADSGNHAVRKIARNGAVTTLAGNGVLGSADGVGTAASFDTPSDVAVDSKGNVYVADTLNHVIRKITADGVVSTITAPSDRIVEYFPGAVEDAGDYQDGPIAKAKFNEPSGLAVDAKDNLYVSDRGNQRIRYIDFASSRVTTVAGGGTYAAQASYVEGDYADGAASSARFNAPEGITVTADGTVVVADALNHAIRLIKDGQVSTLAGVATEYGQADGVPGSAQFNHPTDVAVLADGKLAIADEYGNKIRILQLYAKPANLTTGSGIEVLLDGNIVPSDVKAQLVNNWTYLPARAVSEALGYTVTFDLEKGEAYLAKEDTVYTVKNGSTDVIKSAAGQQTKLTLNAAAFIRQDRIFVPVRFFAEENDLDIQWDQAASTVVIRHPVF